jgi:hypothetical protein
MILPLFRSNLFTEDFGSETALMSTTIALLSFKRRSVTFVPESILTMTSFGSLLFNPSGEETLLVVRRPTSLPISLPFKLGLEDLELDVSLHDTLIECGKPIAPGAQ